MHGDHGLPVTGGQGGSSIRLVLGKTPLGDLSERRLAAAHTEGSVPVALCSYLCVWKQVRMLTLRLSFLLEYLCHCIV